MNHAVVHSSHSLLSLYPTCQQSITRPPSIHPTCFGHIIPMCTLSCVQACRLPTPQHTHTPNPVQWAQFVTLCICRFFTFYTVAPCYFTGLQAITRHAPPPPKGSPEHASAMSLFSQLVQLVVANLDKARCANVLQTFDVL